MLAGVHHVLDFASIATLGVLNTCNKHFDTLTVSMQPQSPKKGDSPRLSFSSRIADAVSRSCWRYGQ